MILSTPEFLLYGYASALHRVLLVFVSGARGLCGETAAINPAITTVEVSCGVRDSTISLAQKESRRRIKAGLQSALGRDWSDCYLTLPERFDMEGRYIEANSAYGAAYYPGHTQTSPYTIAFQTDEYVEALRMPLFTA